MSIAFVFCFLWALTYPVLLTAQEQAYPLNRNPAVAGSFYPAGKQALELSLQKLFYESKPAVLEGTVQTLIVPHAGYPYSGMVAASGYKSIPKDAIYKNIFIIASSHRAQFKGASVYSIGNYISPLGEAKVNQEIANMLIEKNKGITFHKEAHDREHSIEVQLPFLQYHLEDLPPIVPILIGSSTVSAARDLAAALLPYFVPENLFIISSDFSHYPDYEDAKLIDGRTGDAILKKNPEYFYSMLGKISREPVQNLSTPCCGWSSVLTMLYMAERKENLKISPVIYRNSGDTPIGDKQRVVGYWAIAGHEVRNEHQAYGLDDQDKKALLEVSRKTLVSYLQTGNVPRIQEDELPESLKQAAGAFVSLYMGGRLRGCIGNFSPTIPLYQVVQEMSLAAATRDHRFVPVTPSELDYMSIEISVLTPLQKISSIDEFQLGKHGIYMVKDGKSGTYLPQVGRGSGWSKEEFLGRCAREKAGIGWDGWKEADLYVYEAIVFEEEKKE